MRSFGKGVKRFSLSKVLCISQFSPACKIGSVNKVKLSKICANWKKSWASQIFNTNLEFLLCQNRLLLCPICPDSSRCPGECIYIGNQYYVNISNYEDQLDIQWSQTTQCWIGLFRRFTWHINMELYNFLPKLSCIIMWQKLWYVPELI